MPIPHDPEERERFRAVLTKFWRDMNQCQWMEGGDDWGTPPAIPEELLNCGETPTAQEWADPRDGTIAMYGPEPEDAPPEMEAVDRACAWSSVARRVLDRMELEDREAGRTPGGDGPPLKPLQKEVLAALDGHAFFGEALANHLGVSPDNLHRAALKDLLERGLIANVRGVGYYRPDAPPR